MTDSDYYVGRFAPSPTGPLHFGSLVAALASYLDARHHNGLWLLRIEDLDPPRESPDAPQQIMSQLKGFGMHWDGEVLYQSDRLDAYQQALDQLRAENLVYPCTCTRKMVGTIYNGRCRKNDFNINAPYAIRLVIGDMVISFKDRVMGPLYYHLDKDVGDFIIKRKDGLFAYQLAVAVDDAFQQVTHVVRGADLLDSTPRQIAVCRQLNLIEPSYTHVPVITGKDGSKLSKQT
ncbi:MAG: tRNA glutamyl-Q(34) synthetase GluQRS, partial [Pseudomonadales bacterium]